MKVSLGEWYGYTFFSETFINEVSDIAFGVFYRKNISAPKVYFELQCAVAKIHKTDKGILAILSVL